MKIFIFEDSETEANNAAKAVNAAGHEAVIVSEVIRLSLSDKKLFATRSEPEPVKAQPVAIGGVQFPDFAELRDDPEHVAGIERSMARRKIWETMNEIVSMHKAGESVAILTDLMFRLKKGNLSPSGLVVTTHAVANGVPVCICTDLDHHGKDAGFIYDGYMTPMQSMRGKTVFNFVSSKDWARAVKFVSK